MCAVFGLGTYPDYDVVGKRVDLAHSLNLSAAFINIGLVDRDSVDPKRALPIRISEMS